MTYLNTFTATLSLTPTLIALSLPLPSARSLLFGNLLALLIPSLPLSLSRSTLSLFCLSVLQDNLCVHPPSEPLSSLYRREVTNRQCETLLAEAFCVAEPVGGERDETFACCSRNCTQVGAACRKKKKTCTCSLCTPHNISTTYAGVKVSLEHQKEIKNKEKVFSAVLVQSCY